MGRRRSRRKAGGSFRLAAAIVRPVLMTATRRDWHGQEHLPEQGGFVVASNHLSHLDPLTLAHFLWDNGHPVRFLAKDSVFRIPVAGRVITGAGQIPVYRESGDAARAFSAAVEAVRAGECVGIYPDATLTRDPDLWPMVGKTGAARIALSTGCPVIPVAQWGPHEVLPPYGRRPDVLPRKTMRVSAGPPVDLSQWQDQPLSPAVLRAATDAITARIVGLLEEIRGEQAPAQRWNPREHPLPRSGNPRPRKP